MLLFFSSLMHFISLKILVLGIFSNCSFFIMTKVLSIYWFHTLNCMCQSAMVSIHCITVSATSHQSADPLGVPLLSTCTFIKSMEAELHV